MGKVILGILVVMIFALQVMSLVVQIHRRVTLLQMRQKMTVLVFIQRNIMIVMVFV